MPIAQRTNQKDFVVQWVNKFSDLDYKIDAGREKGWCILCLGNIDKSLIFFNIPKFWEIMTFLISADMV